MVAKKRQRASVRSRREPTNPRHGTTLSDAQVAGLLQLFRLLERKGDPIVLIKSAPLRRFRSMLVRIESGERKQ